MNCIHCKSEVTATCDPTRIIFCDNCTNRLVRTYSLDMGEETLENRLERLAKARNKPKKPYSLPKHMIMEREYE